MAYFSNSSEGAIYEARYCSKCKFDDADNGCPIWDAHLCFVGVGDDSAEAILDMLIPQDESGNNLKCNFWTEAA